MEEEEVKRQDEVGRRRRMPDEVGREEECAIERWAGSGFYVLMGDEWSFLQNKYLQKPFQEGGGAQGVFRQ